MCCRCCHVMLKVVVLMIESDTFHMVRLFLLRLHISHSLSLHLVILVVPVVVATVGVLNVLVVVALVPVLVAIVMVFSVVAVDVVVVFADEILV